MKKYKAAVMTMALLLMSATAYSQQHALFDGVLKSYVKEGKVQYEPLCDDVRLPQYLDQLSATDPEALQSREEQLAFWINAYNAFTLKVICDDYPIKSMNDLNFGGLLVSVALKKTVWDRDFILINGEEYSLKQIEHDIIRPRFMEPRSHLAIACGAVSCPPLSSSAYEARTLNDQLTAQAKRFFTMPAYNSFDREKKVARLSMILNWNERYFAPDQKGILVFASRFLDIPLEDTDNWKIKYNKYELRLNDAKE